MREKDDVSQRDEYQFLDQGALQCAGRAVDELRPVVERFDTDARRKSGFKLIELLFDGVDHVQRVDAVSRDHDTADRRLTVLVQSARAKRITELYFCEVA